jgi:hypothetical protein
MVVKQTKERTSKKLARSHPKGKAMSDRKINSEPNKPPNL